VFRENLSSIWHDVHRIKHKRDRDAHPCQLPEKLLKRVISLSSNQGDAVMDCFLGTGTSAVVAKKLDRHSVGIEADKSYISITENRLSQIEAKRKTEENSAVQLTMFGN